MACSRRLTIWTLRWRIAAAGRGRLRHTDGTAPAISMESALISPEQYVIEVEQQEREVVSHG